MGKRARVNNEVSGPVEGTVVQAGAVSGGLHVHLPQRQYVIPRQLPAPPSVFSGRSRELETLDDMLHQPTNATKTVLISAIGGVGGIGKTAIALRWAHENADRYPDGQLYVDLRGFSPFEDPLTPAAAVRILLDAFGVDPIGIPADPASQSALYRSITAGKNILVVLDNARDTSQVLPLLPGSPTCTVLVTSRNRLSGLQLRGARILDLDVLDADEAHVLLARMLSASRVDHERTATAEILDYCQGLPLAISIVAARAAHRDLPLESLAAELRDESARLDALDACEPGADLRAVLSVSYRSLDDETARLFGLLGAAPGADISSAAAASLVARPLPHARRLLRRLEAAYLVQEYLPDRYRMHDIVRLVASERANETTEDAAPVASLRLIDFYLHSAYSAHLLLDSHIERIELSPPPSGCTPVQFDDVATAVTWLESERHNFPEVQNYCVAHNLHERAWQMARALTIFHRRGGHLAEAITAWETALASAQVIGNLTAQAWSRIFLGHNYSRMAMHDKAFSELQLAHDLARQSGDDHARAYVHATLARHWQRRGNDTEALLHATKSLEIYRALGLTGWIAEALNLVGWYQARLGWYEEARGNCENALELNRRRGSVNGEADALDSLGYAAHRAGRYDEAITCYSQALASFGVIRNVYAEATTLDRLAHAQLMAGDRHSARKSWRQALELYRDQSRTSDFDRVRSSLTEIDAQ